MVVFRRENNTSDDDIELARALACQELGMTREEAIHTFLREWLERYGYLPIQHLDEGSETEGSV